MGKLKFLNFSTKDYLKWFFLALAIRSVVFVFFYFQFKQNWPSDLIHSSIVVFHNDSPGYYEPLEAMSIGLGYDSVCRMPGLAPIYALIRAVFSQENTILFIVFLQVIVGAMSVVALASAAYRLIGTKLAHGIVFWVYAISTFVSIWDHAALSDSFSISFLVFGFYFLVKLKEDYKWYYALLFGLFLTWSIFHRPAHIIIFPVVFLFILAIKGLNLKSLKNAISFSFIAILPFIIVESLWVKYNHDKTGRIFFLQDKDELCFATLASYHVAVRNLVIERGGDFKEWSKQTELAWIMDGKAETKFNFRDDYFTNSYPQDSLIELKRLYTISRLDSIPIEERNIAKFRVEKLALAMSADYKENRKFDYYLLSRLRQLQLLAFSGKVENLPLPSVANSNIFELAVKVFYMLLLHSIVLFFLIGLFYALYCRNLDILAVSYFPVAVLLLIGAFFGYAEQRYLTPAYPFMLVVTAFIINEFTKKRGLK